MPDASKNCPFDPDYICNVLEDLMAYIQNPPGGEYNTIIYTEGWQRASQIIHDWRNRGKPKGI
jgi:hypothetical protein